MEALLACAGHVPLFCVCQTASAIPHRPERTKKTGSWAGFGCHSRKTTMQERWMAAPGQRKQNRTVGSRGVETDLGEPGLGWVLRTRVLSASLMLSHNAQKQEEERKL